MRASHDSVNAICKSPRECAMQLEVALDFIRDRGMEKTAAVIDAAIKYLNIYQMEIDDERRNDDLQRKAD